MALSTAGTRLRTARGRALRRQPRGPARGGAASDGGHRVYFSGRDAQGARGSRSSRPISRIRPWSSECLGRPVLDLGPLGAFDDSGVTTSCLVAHEGRKYLYYTGWSLGVTVPFYLAAGLAVSEDGGETFRRVSRGADP